MIFVSQLRSKKQERTLSNMEMEDEFPKGPLVFILMVFLLVMTSLMSYDSGFKNGQIEAANDRMYYEYHKRSDGRETWIETRKPTSTVSVMKSTKIEKGEIE